MCSRPSWMPILRGPQHGTSDRRSWSSCRRAPCCLVGRATRSLRRSGERSMPSLCWSVSSRRAATCLQSVPVDFQVAWARAHVDVFQEWQRATAARDADAIDTALRWYLLLPDLLLRGRRRGGARGRTLIASRFDAWAQGRRTWLITELIADRRRAVLHARSRRRRSRAAAQADMVGRVQELVEEGQLARAARLLRSSGICEVTPEVLEQLRLKHPRREHPVPDVIDGVFPAVSVTLEDTFRRLRRFSAPGRSGRRGEHLTALTRRFSDARARLVMPLYDAFGSAAASASLPRWFYAVWGTSWICPLRKPVPEGQVAPEQPDARPISIGESDLRAVLGQLVQDATPAVMRHLAPVQVSCGVPGGVSTVIHGMRTLLEVHPDWVIIRIDLRNAFNTVSRAVMLRRFSEVPGLSHLVPLLHVLYGAETALVIGGDLEELFAGVMGAGRRGSSEGGRQGMPEMPPAFCIAMQLEARALDAELAHAGGCARFIMDDGYAAGPRTLVFAALERFIYHLRIATNLVAQRAKFVAYSPAFDLTDYAPLLDLGGTVSTFTGPTHPDGPNEVGYGVMVGGVPVGDRVYEQQQLHVVVTRIESYSQHISDQLRDASHDAWALHHYCVAPDFDHWLRHVYPQVAVPFARRVDAAALDFVATIAEEPQR